MTDEELAAIRERVSQETVSLGGSPASVIALLGQYGQDAQALLAEVERLRAEHEALLADVAQLRTMVNDAYTRVDHLLGLIAQMHGTLNQ